MATENAGSLRWTLEADDSQLVSSLDNASKGISDLSKALKQSEKDLSNTGKAAKDAGKEVDSIKNDPIEALSSAASDCAKSFLNLQNSIGELSSSFANVRSAGANLFSDITTSANAAINAVAGVSTAIGGLIADYANQGIQGADFIAQANAQLIGLTHSVEGANSALAQSVQYYKNNPFDRFSTISATKQLLTFGNAVEDIGPLLNKVGNVALANGVSIDEMARRYAETTSQQTVMVGQLDELAQVAPGIWAALGKQVGKSAGEVRDSLNMVGIDVETVKKAFDTLVDEDAMAAFEKTLARQTNRVKGRLSDVAAAIAGYTTDAQYGFKALDDGLYMSVVNLQKSFADVLTSSTETGQRMQAVLGRIGKAIAPVIDRITNNMPQIINKVIDLLEKLAGVIEKVSNTLTSSETDWKAFIPIVALLGSQLLGFVSTITGGGGAAGGLMGAIGQLGSGVKGLSVPMLAFGGVLVKQMATNKDFRESVGELMSSLGQLATKLFDVFASMADSGVLTSVLEALVKALTALANIINELPTPVLEAFIYAIIAGSTASKIGTFTASIISMGQSMKSTGTQIIDFAKKLKTLTSVLSGSSIATSVGSGAKKAEGGITESVKSQMDSLSSASQQLTKAQSMMKTMRMGIQNIILIAGAIAAMAVALRVAYVAIPDDIGGLVAKLSVIAVVVAAMAGLGYAIEKVKISQSSIFKMIEIAGSVALMGIALAVTNSAVPEDLGELGNKLTNIISVIVIFGTIAKAIDMAKISNKSIITLIGIAGSLAALGVALALANAAIPNDVAVLSDKMVILTGIVTAIGGLSILIEKMGVSFKSIGILASVAAVIALAGAALMIANNAIPNDLASMSAKLGAMAGVLSVAAIIMGIIGKFAQYVGLGAIVTAVLSGALALSAVALATVSNYAAQINYANLAILEIAVGLSAVVLGIIGSFAAFIALGAVVTAVLSGALLLSAIALAKASEEAARIDLASLLKFEGSLAVVSTIMALLTPIAAIGAVGATASAFLSGAFLVAAIALSTASDYSKKVDGNSLINISVALAGIAGIQAILTPVLAVASVGATLSAFISGALIAIAAGLKEACEISKEINPDDIDGLQTIVKKLAELETGGFWNSLGKAASSGALAVLANNIKSITKNIKQAIESLEEINSLVGANNVDLYVDKVIHIVEKLSEISLGEYTKNIEGAVSSTAIEKLAKNIGKIIEQVKGIVNNLEELTSLYGKGAVDEMVTKAIGIMESFAGIQLEDGSRGWFQASAYEQVANDVENITKTAEQISKIVESAKGIVTNLQELTDNGVDVEAKVQQAADILADFAGVQLESGDRGWFQGNVYEDVSKDAENVGKTATAIGNIVNTAKTIVDSLKTFTDANIDVGAYVDKAKEILNKFAEIEITGDNLQKTSENAGYVNTTVENVGTILGSAQSVVNNLKFFVDNNVDVGTVVENTKTIINKFAEIEITGENLQKTSENAGYLNTTADNVNKILETAKGIIEKVRYFADNNIDVAYLINGEGNENSVNKIIGHLADINIDGGTAVQKTSEASGYLNTTVQNVTNILNNMQALATSLKTWLESDVNTSMWKMVDEINYNLQKLADIKIVDSEGATFAGGEQRVKEMDFMLQYVNKIKEVFAALNSMPEVTAEKLTGIQTVVEFINNNLLTLSTKLNEYASNLNTIGQSYAQNFIDGWNAKLPDATKQGAQMANNLKDGILSKFQEIYQAGRDTQGRYWNGVNDKIGDEYAQGQSMAQKLIDGLNSKNSEFYNIGANAVQGFANGTGAVNFYSMGRSIASSFIQGIKDRGEQGSPWRTTFESGAFAVQGMVEGMASEQRNLVNKAESLASAVQNAFDGTSASITPELNSTAQRTPTVYASTPEMFDNEQIGGNGRVVINQTNNNYTDYSIRKINRDLRWQLSTI